MENKAKEYAQVLVNRFYTPDMSMKITYNEATQCALICVQEMINIAPRRDVFPPNIGIIFSTKEFLQSVKQEIEAL
jgi:hypothetical protein